MHDEPTNDQRMLAWLDAALDQSSDTREAWVRDQLASDRVMCERILTSLAASGSIHLRTGGGPEIFVDAELPTSIGAYRITARIGQGGMGAVYRGERMTGDFDHVAAIKLIRPGALSDALVERFQRERQTLAALSHPNIARLFDGGATPSGDPYIVMELVDGVPLGTWIARGDADAAARTAVFLAICDAVGFAHQNLIVHRDITLTNILVTQAGVPKLIDFGIARPPAAAAPADRSTAAPNAEALSLTPGFAAPERVAGESATTLSDIYSLGVVLDRLFPEPRAADVAAIIAKARAVAPEDRYPSADALAEDVKAWRDGFPVAARGDAKSYIARRFIARNRFAVAASVVVFALLVGALVTTLIANHRANLARADAERRFAQTRAIAKTMIFDAYDQVSRVPGSTRARETLAQAGLRYLDTLAADRDAPFTLRVETGQGYARLADVIGSGQTSQLGRLADGKKLLDRAERILTRAHAERPDDAVTRRALAALLADRAQVALYDDNDVARARTAATTARRLIAPDARADADSAALYIRALAAEADANIWDRKWAEAKPVHQAAEAFVTGLPPALRDAPAVRAARAGNLRLMGETLHKLDEKEPARLTLDRATEIYEAVLAQDPTDPRLLRQVVVANRYRAVVHRSNYRDAPAAASIARAADLTERLRRADPNDEASARMWLVVAELQAQILMDGQRVPETFALHDRILAEYRRLLPLSGDAAGIRRNFSSALRVIGADRYRGANYPGACTAWRESLALITWLSAHRDLTSSDKTRKDHVDGYIAKACDNGGPRKGLGDEFA